MKGYSVEQTHPLFLKGHRQLICPIRSNKKTDRQSFVVGVLFIDGLYKEHPLLEIFMKYRRLFVDETFRRRIRHLIHKVLPPMQRG